MPASMTGRYVVKLTGTAENQARARKEYGDDYFPVDKYGKTDAETLQKYLMERGIHCIVERKRET